MAPIFDFSLIRTSDSLRSSLVVSTYLGNMGTAVGITLQSCIEAEICAILHLLLVNGSHLWFLTDPNIGHSYEFLWVVLPDLKNMDIRLGISFISCIEAKICVTSYLLPVNGSHLWFLTDPNIGDSYEYFSRVAPPRKHTYSCWNFVAITYTTKDISVRLSLLVHDRHFDFRHGFLLSVIFVIGGNSAVLKNIIPIIVLLTIGLLH